MESLVDLQRSLNLQRADENQSVGVYRGYPLGLTVVPHKASTQRLPNRQVMVLEAPDARPWYSLLFQLRHPLRTEALPDKDAYAWDERPAALLDSGKAAVSVEDRIAWLRVYEAAELVENGTMLGVLDAFVDGLAAAGVQNQDDRCHYCGQNHVEQVTWIADRAAWICPECLERETAEEPAAPEDPAKLVLAGAVGAIVGAVIWTGIWIIYDLVIEWFVKGSPTGRVHVPHLAVGITGIIGGVLFGAPTGLLIRRVRSRAIKLAKVIGVMSIVLAAALGEIVHSTWLVYHLYGVISPRVAVHVLPQIWGSGGSPLAVQFVLMIVGGLFVAYGAAKAGEKRIRV